MAGLEERDKGWIVHVLDDLIQYARWHQLERVADTLSTARDRVIEQIRKEDPEGGPERMPQEFKEVLDDLILHCRGSGGLEEVLDHLMEAQMAWAELADKSPGDNVVTLSNRRKAHNGD